MRNSTTPPRDERPIRKALDAAAAEIGMVDFGQEVEIGVWAVCRTSDHANLDGALWARHIESNEFLGAWYCPMHCAEELLLMSAADERQIPREDALDLRCSLGAVGALAAVAHGEMPAEYALA